MIYDIISFLVDCALLIWFFRRVGPFGKNPLKIVLGALVLFIPLQYYLRVAIIQSRVVNYLARAITAGFFLLLTRKISRLRCVYFGILYASLLTATQAIFPYINILLGIENSRPLQLLSHYGVEFVVFTVISSAIPFEKLTKPTPVQWVFSVVLGITVIYTKKAMGQLMKGAFILPTELTLYPLIILALVLFAIGWFDYFCVMKDEQSRRALIDMNREYQYKSLQERLSAQDGVYELYHDMKNHLLSMDAMSSENQREYIQGVLGRLKSYELLADTGNPTLDGLMNEKILSAGRKGIRMNIQLDISPLSHVDPVDICAIFGNAVDNAIEAAEQVKEENRFIAIKSGVWAGNLVVTISNSSLGTPISDAGGLPETTKREKNHHGIGMASMRRSLRQYGGSFTYSVRDGGTFILTLMLPLKSDK